VALLYVKARSIPARIEARGSAREQSVEARGSAREQYLVAGPL